MHIMYGTNRIVFVFKSLVIKIPNFTYSWCHFLTGLVANIQENYTWKYNSGNCEQGKSYLLCPVIWASWGGWILLMKRADVKKFEAYVRNLTDNQEDIYKKWVEAGFGGDDKVYNYGYYEDRIVKIDYA